MGPNDAPLRRAARREAALTAENAALRAEAAEKGRSVSIVFDGPPGARPGRFVEVEDADGHGINIGEWVERDDGCWALVIQVGQAESLRAENARLKKTREKLGALFDLHNLLPYLAKGADCTCDPSVGMEPCFKCAAEEILAKANAALKEGEPDTTT